MGIEGYTGNRQPDERWNKELKAVHKGLYLTWWECTFGGRWAVRFKDERTGLDRLVLFVDAPNCEYREMGEDILQGIKETIDWKKVDENPEPEKLFQAVQKEYDDYKRRARLREMGIITDYNREHRKEWKKAMEMAMRDPKVAAGLKRAAAKKWANRKIKV